MEAGTGSQGHSSDLPGTQDGHEWSYTKSSIKRLMFDTGLS